LREANIVESYERSFNSDWPFWRWVLSSEVTHSSRCNAE
jgi:hypothetical protein